MLLPSCKALVCVCGCPDGLLVKSWAHNPEDAGLIPGQEGKFLSIKIVPPAPICKTGTWSCTGEQSALAVPHEPLMVLVGLHDAHTCSGRYSSTPASSLPGLQEIAPHRHDVPA